MERGEAHSRLGAMYQCIYCLRRLPDRDFNREHVLSKAFGTFKDAPVLHRCVCRQCNQFFADELEMRVARGAFEGMLRHKHGIRTPTGEALNFRYVEFTIPGKHDWSGVRLRVVNEASGLRVTLIPQVAFLASEQERWVHVTVGEIDAGLLLQRPNFKKSRIRIFAGLSHRCSILGLQNAAG